MMGTEIWCLVLLVGLLAWQQYFFSKQIHALLDKLMSRSFTEYQQAKEPINNKRLQVPLDLPEDLRSLQEFRL